ncbi:MAG TPA: hypothetical protein VJ738_08390 [Steroidobacteraceae bacterium]|nr:hypothetical protein [Steroidobacteraceae bacterium]
MSLRIERATANDAPGVQALNQRLRDGRGGYRLPEEPEFFRPSPPRTVPVWHEFFVAQDQDAVRGGYLLKREPLRIGCSALELWNYQLPVSEGIVNRAYATVGIQLLQDAMKRSELLYCLGMGSLKRPLPRLLSRFHWSVESVPFFFRVIHSSGFLNNRYLLERRGGAMLISLARYSGLGALATCTWRLASRVRQPELPHGLVIEEPPSFGTGLDVFFLEVQQRYGALVERTAAVLNARYPHTDARLIRLVVRRAGKIIGWLVLTRNDLHDHKQFGSMRLGCIVDGLCDPEMAPVMIRLGTDRLIAERVDLIVSNQTHMAWTAGLRRCGFVSGPSNFIFARSPALTARTPRLEEWHMNRGDGDGPINL